MNLQENEIAILPPQINLLTELSELALHDNRLLKVPPEIGDLPRLKELTLHANQFLTLPDLPNKMKTMKKLTLDDHVVEDHDELIHKLVSDGCNIMPNLVKRSAAQLRLLKKNIDKAEAVKSNPHRYRDDNDGFSALANAMLNEDTRDIDDILADLGELGGGANPKPNGKGKKKKKKKKK